MQDGFNDIENWRCVDEDLSTSGILPLDEAVYRRVARSGTRTIIDLSQGAFRYNPEFATRVTGKLGIAYINLPVKLDAPSMADYDEFCRQIPPFETAPRHVHCTGGGICLAFLYRRALDGRGGEPAHLHTIMDSVWRPGGAWAEFVRDTDSATKPTRWARKDYDPCRSLRLNT